MKNTKHTPGPWKVDKVIRARYDEKNGSKLADQVTIFIYPDNIKKENFNLAVVNDYCVPESEANARLIAAAPSMYEEINEAIGWFESMNMAGCSDEIKEVLTVMYERFKTVRYLAGGE